MTDVSAQGSGGGALANRAVPVALALAWGAILLYGLAHVFEGRVSTGGNVLAFLASVEFLLLSLLLVVGLIAMRWWRHPAAPATQAPVAIAPAPDSSLTSRPIFWDSLTGLPSRPQFERKLEMLIEAEKHLSIGVINIDGFKPVSDLYGHAAGDEIIRQVAMRLSGAVMDKGIAARLGGSQFAVLLEETNGEDALEFGTLLVEVLTAHYDLEGRKVRLSAFAGFASHPFGDDDGEAIVYHAETALTRAKRAGRSAAALFSPEMAAELKEEARLIQALRVAIDEKRIRPNYQPIVDLESQRVLGFEALARWEDPEFGPISPALFIPIAERHGLIAELTSLLLELAATEARTWPADIFLSFNLSATQLSDAGTGEEILGMLKRVGLPPHRLEIEITETALMTDYDTSTQIIESLRDAGVRISLDDFGTGHSSLGHLRRLTLDKVKIDRCFITGIGREKESDHIVRAILELCAGLDLKVVAEGIEELQQASGLQGFGCDAGQGFLFGRPVDARTVHETYFPRATVRVVN